MPILGLLFLRHASNRHHAARGAMNLPKTARHDGHALTCSQSAR
jgi:hypothetical protein